VLCARFPSIELLRFTNSGKEANLMAVSVARAITKQSKLVFVPGFFGAGYFRFTMLEACLASQSPCLLGKVVFIKKAVP